jgi:predicted transcriptional regulator of viral defense system
MNTLKDYIDSLSAHGEIAFTIQQAAIALASTPKGVECAIYRLKRKGEIVSPAKGYYLILPPEFRKLGCLPPDYFIDQLMQHLQQPYYVGCLSAALYLGAAHQQPQIFQIITNKYKKNITLGSVHIEFILKNNFFASPTETIKTRTGTMQISTPEATLLDLVIFIKRNGGINQVATVISELAEKIQPETLKKMIEKNIELSYLQRIGYLLETTRYELLANIVHEQLKTKKMNTAPLVPYYSTTGASRNKKWKIAINTNIESDLNDSY